MNSQIDLKPERYRQIVEKRSSIRNSIIAAYDSTIIRIYCYIRFRIIHLRLLDELEQYLPARGTVLDLGCGFGLFSIYFALLEKERKTISVDLDQRRIAMAQKTASRLGTGDRNNFAAINVLDYPFTEPVDAIITLDLLHHLPTGAVPAILAKCYEVLSDNGVLIVKDVDSEPAYKAAFTWMLDKAMDFRTPIHYYHRSEMVAMLEAVGFEARHHTMWDALPYPHMMYVCRKQLSKDP